MVPGQGGDFDLNPGQKQLNYFTISAILNKRSSQDGPDDEFAERKKKKYGFGYSLSDKMW